MARWDSALDFSVQTGLCFDEPTNACWFGTTDGKVGSFRILGQKPRTLGSGWADAVAVLPSNDGLHLFVVVATGDVLVVARENAHRTKASVIASTGVAPCCRLAAGEQRHPAAG